MRVRSSHVAWRTNFPCHTMRYASYGLSLEALRTCLGALVPALGVALEGPDPD